MFRVRFHFGLSLFVTIVLAAAAQAQGQPGAAPSAAGTSPSKTNAVPPDQRVVLKVGDLQITQASFEQYLADLEAQQGPASLSRKKLGDNYASILMLSQLAAANHLESSPEVMRQIAIDRMQILSNAEFAKLKAQSAATPEEVKAYYNEHLADYDVVDVRRIFVWAGDPASKQQHTLTQQQADALAEAIHHAYTTGGDVDKLIKDTPHSSEDVAVDAKPLPFQRGEMPPQLDEPIFQLKEGEWKEFHNGPGSYAFFHVLKKSHRDLNDVSPQIEKKLQAQKLRQQLESLKKQTGIWMDETYFVSKPEVPKLQDRD